MNVESKVRELEDKYEDLKQEIWRLGDAVRSLQTQVANQENRQRYS